LLVLAAARLSDKKAGEAAGLKSGHYMRRSLG
jgi:hypothetical protein